MYIIIFIIIISSSSIYMYQFMFGNPASRAPKPNLKIESRTLFHWSSLVAEDRSPVKVEI